MHRPIREVARSETASVVPPEAESAAKASLQQPPTLEGFPTTILLVDDDDDLRYVTEMILSIRGYDVISCNAAKPASAAFHDAPCISLLLTDMQMPERSGIELARELTAIHPSLPVLIVSGSMPPLEVQVEMRDRRWTFLNKTADELALLHAVATLMK